MKASALPLISLAILCLICASCAYAAEPPAAVADVPAKSEVYGPPAPYGPFAPPDLRKDTASPAEAIGQPVAGASKRLPELLKSARELRARGDLDGAIGAWRAALASGSHSPDVFADLGDALAEKGDIDAGIRQYAEAVGLGKRQTWSDGRVRDGDLQFRFALLLLRANAYPDAVALFRWGLVSLSRDEKGQLRIEWSEAGLQSDARERRRLEATIHLALGMRYMAQGKVDRSAEQTQAAADIFPDDPAIQLRMGDVLAAKGRFTDAHIAWLRAAGSDNLAVRDLAARTLRRME
jgi:tetratricopeptide (TPR) repeat protein